MNHIFTDGGRSAAGFSEEKNDCVVRSYAIATGLEYKEAYRLLEIWGRKQNTGVMLIHFIASEKNFFPHIFTDCKRKNLTVGRFIKENPNGKYIVAIKGHAFAVIDGIVHDMCGIFPKCKIKFFIQII